MAEMPKAVEIEIKLRSEVAELSAEALEVVIARLQTLDDACTVMEERHLRTRALRDPRERGRPAMIPIATVRDILSGKWDTVE